MNSPKVGQSVYIPFTSNGEGQKVNGAALLPFDKIEAVYSETDVSKSGKKVYNVRVKSGDVVRIMDKNDKWEAVA